MLIFLSKKHVKLQFSMKQSYDTAISSEKEESISGDSHLSQRIDTVSASSSDNAAAIQRAKRQVLMLIVHWAKELILWLRKLEIMQQQFSRKRKLALMEILQMHH